MLMWRGWAEEIEGLEDRAGEEEEPPTDSSLSGEPIPFPTSFLF